MADPFLVYKMYKSFFPVSYVSALNTFKLKLPCTGIIYIYFIDV